MVTTCGISDAKVTNSVETEHMFLRLYNVREFYFTFV